MTGEVKIEFVLNGKTVEEEVEPNITLLDFLRSKLGKKGTKKGCDKGECGSCTVLLDGKAVNSCLVLAPQVDEKEVTTIEGLGSPEDLHPLQEAFIDNKAVQCGFCAPGMLLTAKALLDENPSPNEEDVRTSIEGNLCRCTAYQKITQSILDAAEKLGRDET